MLSLVGVTTSLLSAQLTSNQLAHGNLYGIGILHRDISNKTILLGRDGAEVGEQGILIDLSVAFDFEREADSEINKEPIMVGLDVFTLCWTC
jgi:hypothetical protein